MTLHISFRSNESHGASLSGGRGFETTGLNPAGAIDRDVAWIARQAVGKRVLFAVHGFNVRWTSWLAQAAQLEANLKAPTAPFPLTEDALFIAIAWPGDWWVKVVNYSFEADDAVKSGGHLAELINTLFGDAASISFVSHSLGARVALSAAQSMREDPLEIILTAPATDNNCLVRQYGVAREKARRVSVLSSKRDKTLKYAYGPGDFLSDILGDDDSPFGGALGYRGPKPANLEGVSHLPIAGKPNNAGGQLEPLSDFDHTDYFPNATNMPKSATASRYISAAFAAQGAWWR